MSYFNHFPLVRYNNELQVNLTRRVAIDDTFRTNPAYFIDYSIQESDTPEIIADKIYDDATLAWVVLSMNNIVDMFEEWPLDYYSLQQYTLNKYSNVYATHHYISASTGEIVDPELNPAWDNIAVTNYDYEYAVNEDKRNIKLLLPDYVGTVTARLKELMRVENV